MKSFVDFEHFRPNIISYPWYFIEFILFPAVPMVSPNGQRADDSSNFTLMSMLLIFAVILYLFRPNSLRRSTQSHDKPSQPPNDQNVNCFFWSPLKEERIWMKSWSFCYNYRDQMAHHQLYIDPGTWSDRSRQKRNNLWVKEEKKQLMHIQWR